MFLDFNRPDDDYISGHREVLNSRALTFRVDETDDWCDMPVRTVIDSCGPHLELGPYSISGSDACALANALITYGRISGDFHLVDDIAE